MKLRYIKRQQVHRLDNPSLQAAGHAAASARESSSKIRIVYLTDKLAFGGTPLQIVELALHLERERFEPHCVILSAIEPSLVDRLHQRGIGVDCIGRAHWIDPRAVSSFARLYLLLKKLRPDIIHAFLPTSNVLAAITGALFGKPVTISSHRDLGGFDGKGITALNDWLDQRVVDCVTANSEAVRRSVSVRSGLAESAVRVIYNGIDLERIKAALPQRECMRREFGLKAEATVIAVIANLKPAKGHHLVVEAFSQLVAEFPDAMLLVCGYAADATYAARLEESVATSGIAPQVKFLGSRQDIPAILSAIDVLVSPSDSEGFSNTILEAMAARKAIIATDVGGNREQITDQVDGLLVPAGDVSAMMAALRSLLKAPGLRQQLGQAASHRASQDFSVQRMASEHEQLYMELLERTH